MPDKETKSSDGAFPPALSEHYHKARKQHALFSGLLLCWVLVGIQIDGHDPIENINVTLLTPDVLPVILAIMVMYFAYRTTIEWYQCHKQRRALLASRIDFGVAHLIGVVSLAVYTTQWGIQFRIGASLARVFPAAVVVIISILWGFMIGTVSREAFRIIKNWWRHGRSLEMFPRTVLVLAFFLVSSFQIMILGWLPPLVLVGGLLGAWLMPAKLYDRLFHGLEPIKN